MKSIQNQYIALKEGRMSQANFMRNVRMALPQYISNINSFEDTVKILKKCRAVDFVNGKINIDNLIYSTVTNLKKKFFKLFNSLNEFISKIKINKRKKLGYNEFIRPTIQTYVELVEYRDDYENIVSADPNLISNREKLFYTINNYIKRVRKQMMSLFTKDIIEHYKEKLIY